MDDFKVKTLKVSTNEIGEQVGFDRKAMQGYVAQNKICRIISNDNDKVTDYLMHAHKVPESIRIRVFETREDGDKRRRYKLSEPYEYFTSVEMLKSNTREICSKDCLKALEIYESEGLYEMIDFLQKVMPIIYDKKEKEEV